MSHAAAKAPTQDPPPSAGEAETALDGRIDALLDEIGEAKQEVDGIIADTESAESVVPAASPELEASIDRVIEEAQRSLGEVESEPALKVTAGPGAVSRIDDALAQSADHRMAEAEARAAAETSAPAEPIVETLESEPEFPPAGTSEESVVVPAVVSAPPEPLEPEAIEAQAVPATVTTNSGTGVTPVIISAAGLLAWPMSVLPIELRDLIGWLALVTLFNAACVWLFLLL
jgi:hypothetical protein